LNAAVFYAKGIQDANGLPAFSLFSRSFDDLKAIVHRVNPEHGSCPMPRFVNQCIYMNPLCSDN